MRAAGRPWVVAVLLLALLGLAPVAVTAPPEDTLVLRAMSEGDVFVSTGALGDFAAVVEERLAAQVENLDRRGFAVKFVLVRSLGGDGPFAYARDLRARLGFDGTVLVTTPDGPVGAAGQRSEDSLRGGFAAGAVDTVASPTQRLIAASELALPPPPRDGTAWRELLVLVGLTMLGGAWAIAWGLRREQRRMRAELAERRAILKVGLDALDARARDLESAGDLPDGAAVRLARARDAHRAAMRQVEARSDDLTGAVADMHRGLRVLAEAADEAGRPFSPDAPFDGLCAADPAHGPAEGVAPLADLPTRAPVCGPCRARAEAGDPPARRLVPVDGRPVPFDEVDVPGGPPPESEPADVRPAGAPAPAPPDGPEEEAGGPTASRW